MSGGFCPVAAYRPPMSRLHGQAAVTLDVQRVLFCADDGAYAVLACRMTDERDELTLVGDVAHLDSGDRVAVTGTWKTHPRHGRQLRASHTQLVPLSARKAARRILRRLPGVGPRLADALVDFHGDTVLDALDADPVAALTAVKGIGATRAAAAAEAWRHVRGERALIEALEPVGLTRLAPELLKRHGPVGALEQLRADPYPLCSKRGVTFATVDRLALLLGVDAEHPSRSTAAVREVLASAARVDGHTFLTDAQVRERGFALLSRPLPEESLYLARDRNACVLKAPDVVAAPRLYDFERAIATRVAALRQRAGRPMNLSTSPEMGLSQEQWGAVRMGYSSALSILTGGPGSGKTTTLKALVHKSERAGRTVALCAPTGQAARRLSEATGHPAFTVHRLLGFGRGPRGGFALDAQHPIAADLVICDEASMLGAELAAALFSACGERAHVVLVGDVDQLPSIEPGRVMGDLIDAGVPTTRLRRIHRQAAGSLIPLAAQRVGAGEPPLLSPAPGQPRDFFWERAESDREALERICDLAAVVLPDLGIDPVREALVLCPHKKGDCGIRELDRALAERLNPRGRPLLPDLRSGDRAVFTANDPELDLTNGTILFPLDHGPEGLRCRDDTGREITVPADRLDRVHRSFACTVHRAQGAEARAVIVALPPGTPMPLRSRALLYTALTRGKQLVVLVAHERVVEQAVRVDTTTARQTLLARLLGSSVPAAA